MKTKLDNEQAIIELRELMNSNGLNPPLPDSTRLTDARAENIYARAIEMANTSQTVEMQSVTTSAVAPAKWHNQSKWILAACLAGALAVGVGTHLSGESASPDGLMLAGVNTLNLPGVDLTNIAHAPSATQALIAAQKTAAASGQAGEGTIQYISKIEHMLEINNFDNPSPTNMRIGPVLTEFWIEPDGAARTENTYGPLVPLDQFDQIDFSASVVGEIGSYWHDAPSEFDLRHGPNSFTPWIVADLPREPRQLANALKAQWGGGDDNQALLYSIISLYNTHVVPDDLAAAIWELLSTNPAIRDLGDTTDRIGRPVRALAFESFPNDRHNDSFDLLLVSSVTGRLIGWEWVAVNDATHHVTAPTVLGFTVWLEAKFVERIGDRPS